MSTRVIISVRVDSPDGTPIVLEERARLVPYVPVGDYDEDDYAVEVAAAGLELDTLGREVLTAASNQVVALTRAARARE